MRNSYKIISRALWLKRRFGNESVILKEALALPIFI